MPRRGTWPSAPPGRVRVDRKVPGTYLELEYAQRSAAAEVALELGLADRTSDERVAVAVDLVRRLPPTVAALCAGRVTLAKARVILEETANLDLNLLAEVEAEVLGKAEGLTPLLLCQAAATWTS